MASGNLKNPTLCTKPVLWNTSDTWSWAEANKAYYCRQGNLVILCIKKSGLTPNVSNTILTLPVGYRPATLETGHIHDSGGVSPYTAAYMIYTNGDVIVNPTSNFSSGTLVFYTADAFPS